MIVISCCSFKGGTAKTSVVLHLAVYLAKKGKRVLLIDFDAQANLSTGIGLTSDDLDTMVPVLHGEKAILEVIKLSYLRNLHVITANVFLDGLEATYPIVNDLYGHERLKKAVHSVEGQYDYVFIDTPPSLGWLTQSAFFAAHYTIICVTPEPYSILALNRLKDYHERIQEHHQLTVLGIVLSFWSERGATNEAYLNAIKKAFGNKLFSSKIRRDILVSRAVLRGRSVFDVYPSSKAAWDYAKLGEDFLSKMLCPISIN